MSQELIGDLSGAAEQIYALVGVDQASLSVVTRLLNTADQERAVALFNQLQWHAIRETLPGVDIPPPATPGVKGLEPDDDTE